MFRHYVRLIVFGVGLLCGIQIPALIDQYVKRVDAQLIEAQGSLSGFQTTADRYFDGSLLQLISHYRSSDDDVFVRDADNIAQLYERQQSLQMHSKQLQSSLPSQVWVIIRQADTQIMQRTLETYTYVVMLTPEAITVGAVCAFLLVFLWDLAGGVLGMMFGRRKQASEF